MNLSIYKFPLVVTDYQKVYFPKNARILSAQVQNSVLCIWAICDAKTEEKEEREFEIFGTGNPFYENSHFGKEHKFIATFQQHNGSFVGHLFELVEIVA
jgi:hypothetical protein